MTGVRARVDVCQPLIVLADPHVVLTTWQDVVISVWRTGAGPEHVRQLGATLRSLHAEYPGGVASFSYLDVTGGLRDDAGAREAGKRMTAETKHIVCHHIAVIAGTGFRASALRSILTGFHIGRAAATQIAATTEEGALVLSKRWGRPREWAAELTGVVDRTLRCP